jgi:hypothetical protein
MAQRDEIIRRTVYVSDIDHQVPDPFPPPPPCRVVSSLVEPVGNFPSPASSLPTDTDRLTDL